MASIEVSYFNTFLIKKIVDNTNDSNITAPKWAEGHSNNDGAAGDEAKSWFIEESRIRGGYNNTITDLGVRAYLIETNPEPQDLKTSLIWSYGLYNSRTSYNGINNFSVAENLSKSLDPTYGDINLLYAENTNLTIGQTNKINKALIDKDAIFTGDGDSQITATGKVVGQIIPYAGEFGIKDNRSFAVHGYRKYFVDPNRNAVLRQSGDGFTKISDNGMKDFFRDELNKDNADIVSTGYYDIHTEKYYVTIFDRSGLIAGYHTLSFSEVVKGWVSRYSFAPEYAKPLKSDTYSIAKDPFNRLKIWKMNSGNDCEFFGNSYVKPRIDFIFNTAPSIVKSFKTIEYEGTDDWTCDYFVTDSENITTRIMSATRGKHTRPNLSGYYYAGFTPKENKYYSFLNAEYSNNLEGRVLIFGEGTRRSGIKGFYATTRFSGSDDNTNHQELFTVSVDFTESS